MKRLIIGSTAMHVHFPETRAPKDLDVFTDEATGAEDSYWHPSFAEFIPDGAHVASVNDLLTIKLSHAGWELRNGSWDKHMADVVFLKEHGASVDEPFYAALYAAWEERYGKKRVVLQEESTEFFADAVVRKYDHDSLHRSVAYGDQPIYESVLKDGKSVEMDMRKVWALPFEEQVKLFREEIYVTALERKVIPSDYRASPRAAYHWALRRTVTSLTKGKSSRFIAENYKMFRIPDLDYVQHHLSKAHHLIELGVAAMTTTAEVESLLEGHEFFTNYGGAVYRESGWSSWGEVGSKEEVTIAGLGKVKVLEEDSGGEGHGEYIYFIFEVTGEDGTVRTFRKEGSYYSFDGSNWDGDFSQVVPTEKMTTVWSRIAEPK